MSWGRIGHPSEILKVGQEIDVVVLDVNNEFFFVKQKTAYEMSIGDWSSDVCSSDLFHHDHRRLEGGDPRHRPLECLRRGGARPLLAARRHGDHDLVFADINPDGNTLRHHGPPCHRVSRSYGCPGSRPSQLFGMNDDACERTPMLRYGLTTKGSAGYPLSTCCIRFRRHKGSPKRE